MSGTTDTSPDRPTREDLGKWGVVYGVGAFVAGYVLVYVLKGAELRQNFVNSFVTTGPSVDQFRAMGGSLPRTWQLVGQYYAHGHNADLAMEVTRNGQHATRTISRDFLQGDAVIWVAPIVVLVAAGYLLVNRYDLRDGGDAAKAGMAVTAGYLPASVAGVFLFRWETSIQSAGNFVQLSLHSDLVSTVLFAGLLYPLVFGAVGGVVSAKR